LAGHVNFHQSRYSRRELNQGDTAAALSRLIPSAAQLYLPPDLSYGCNEHIVRHSMGEAIEPTFWSATPFSRKPSAGSRHLAISLPDERSLR
jgi:hypothetical protein